jgi:pyruvate/2-oxoglutarate dehydrogenase complex dihydrolipoamide acyltransferase (E2) component
MILEFKLPLITPLMTEALIECHHAVPGAALKPGDKLFDLSVDLSTSFSQDCPPISYYRIVMRERAFLRELRQAAGQTCKVGEIVALFGTEAEEATDQPPQRAIRFATATIIHHAGMWSGNVH